MIIADTSVWIEYLKGDKWYLKVFGSYLEDRQIIALSPVFGELLQGVKNKREHRIISGFWENLPHIDEEGLFIDAGQVSFEQKLYAYGVGLIDCYILSAGIKYGHGIWTLDKKLLGAIDRLEMEFR